ncbi:MAG: hypothetical protein ACOY33_03050 [Pseudomonadota bacterium]
MNSDESLALHPALPRTVNDILYLRRKDDSLHHVYLMTLRDHEFALRISSHAPLLIEHAPVFEGLLLLESPDWLPRRWQQKRQPDNEEIREIFHRCWSSASPAATYRKSDWKRLLAILERAGYEV